MPAQRASDGPQRGVGGAARWTGCAARTPGLSGAPGATAAAGEAAAGTAATGSATAARGTAPGETAADSGKLRGARGCGASGARSAASATACRRCARADRTPSAERQAGSIRPPAPHGVAPEIRQGAFAIAADAEDRRQGLPGRELQPGFLAVVEHLHGRHGGIAGQLPVEAEALGSLARGLPGQLRRTPAQTCAGPQAGQACRQEEESKHASPRAKGAPEAMRMHNWMSADLAPDWHVRMDALVPLPSPGEKKPGPRTGFPGGAGAAGLPCRDQRCAAMLRACEAALFSAATSGCLRRLR